MEGWKEFESQSPRLAQAYENQLYMDMARDTGDQINVPITIRDQSIGNLTIELGDQSLTPEQLEFINGVATQTAYALENARLLDKTMRRAEREQRALEITSKIRSSSNPQEMIKIAVEELKQSLKVDYARIVKTNSPLDSIRELFANTPPDEQAPQE